MGDKIKINPILKIDNDFEVDESIKSYETIALPERNSTTPGQLLLRFKIRTIGIIRQTVG